MKKFILLFFILLFASVVLGFLYIKNDYEKAIKTPNSENSETVSLTINEGSSVEDISNLLISNNLLKKEYKNYFRYYLKINGIDSKLQAGEFLIPQNLTIEEISSQLQQGGIIEVWVTIPEGLRKDEIADVFASSEFANKEIPFNRDEFIRLTSDINFISTLEVPIENITDLEGLLFPDKYLIPLSFDEKQIITLMIENFKLKVTQIDYDTLKLASIVEREGVNKEERGYIADIFLRRYNEGWFLGSDASVLYILKDWKHTLTYDDLAIQSPYNTYNNLGYPITPICNPGLESINAAIDPTENEYYYYIHDSDGNIHFAKTHYEHQINIETYLSN